MTSVALRKAVARPPPGAGARHRPGRGDGAANRILSRLLFELSPTDPLTIAVAVLVMGGVTLLAGYLPARRATRVDPVTVLRIE